MKSTGIVRRIDPLGRIVLPKELRRTLDIELRDSIEIFTDGDRILLRKYRKNCIICGSESDLMTFKGKPVCRACIESLRRETCE
ncbi:AbrB/MazE/SpoVT family DNA-binding domain-containing protein [Zhenpiania hominis]|uniref:AbrB/MazE/SpoVT family DNA-binding domain-containing protein n=1 Tax=Zhenpiania hominis TaxID=2763644 RepID=A0A923SVP1_9FIRM|nr:AbrB/MazE/SpoVT family DNA-binding domain-containing protein [Zhenpiania hominis]MBC6679543.1 AbrB/MazE/SpoVT family DNA-binding domain-containing protein [Zhenpiania hominis]